MTKLGEFIARNLAWYSLLWLARAGAPIPANPLSRMSQCAVKGAGPQRVQFPPGNWFAPPGSNRSSGLGNEAAGASGVEGREGDLASVQAVT